MGKKKIYNIPVVWEMYGIVGIEAESAEDALDKFTTHQASIDLPLDRSYVEDSFCLANDNEEELLETIKTISEEETK